jgi:hypothetical protein
MVTTTVPYGSKRERFQQTFAIVRHELLDVFAAQGVPDDAQNWYTRVSLQPFILSRPDIYPDMFMPDNRLQRPGR